MLRVAISTKKIILFVFRNLAVTGWIFLVHAKFYSYPYQCRLRLGAKHVIIFTAHANTLFGAADEKTILNLQRLGPFRRVEMAPLGPTRASNSYSVLSRTPCLSMSRPICITCAICSVRKDTLSLYIVSLL